MYTYSCIWATWATKNKIEKCFKSNMLYYPGKITCGLYLCTAL